VRWKEITHVLIACGHAAELYQELNSRTGCEDATGGHALRPAYQSHGESCRGPAISNGSQLIANDAENNRSICEFSSGDEDAEASSLDESDIDDDIYNDLVVPPYLVDEAADLSQRKYASSLLSFEEIFAQERSLAQCNGGQAELDDTPNRLDDDLVSMSGVLPSLTLPSSKPEQNQWLNPSPDIAPEQDLLLELGGRDIIFEETKPMPPQPTLSLRRRNYPTKATRLRVSDKKDLTHAKIPIVADLLISKDAISYFLENCHLIYEGWLPFSAQQPLVCNNSIEASVIAALDTVQDSVKGNRICRLLLRFAYIHLAWVIDAYKAVAATDRVQGKVSRSVGQRDASVAIDMYLKAKRKVSGKELKRSRLLGYCRTGRRWAVLAGRSPIMVFVFPQIAETIVYVPPSSPLLVETHHFERQNNSITDLTVQDIAVQIQHNHPELVRVLVEVGKYTGLACSNTAHIIPCLEDVVAKTYEALGSVLNEARGC